MGKNKANEIKLIRVYEAPVKTVWEVWKDPEQTKQWWGPRGFTLTSHSKELRPGGYWDYTMHGPDGKDFPNYTRYLEVETYSKMVYDHGGQKDKPAMFRVTVLFSEINGKTQMDMTMSLATADAAAATRQYIKKAGGDACWDRLAEYLAKQLTGRERFVIQRSFDTSLETMYQWWSDPKHLSQWLPPTGATMDIIRADIRPGGNIFYSMTVGQGNMYGRAGYLELKRPERLVYTQQFCDEKEKVSRHPLAPTWPETMHTTVQFTEEGPQRTRVTITWEPYGKTTPEELDTFIKMKGGMTQGWTGSLDKLEESIPPAT